MPLTPRLVPFRNNGIGQRPCVLLLILRVIADLQRSVKENGLCTSRKNPLGITQLASCEQYIRRLCIRAKTVVIHKISSC